MSNSFFGRFLEFYKISEPDPSQTEKNKDHYKQLMLSTFCTATLGYGMYYVCRLSMNVIRKPIVDEGLFSETQLGLIGSSMLFVYAIGKLSNGFIADRSNVKRLMSTGLFITALINLCLGFTSSFYVFVLLWGVNGWVQSMGAASGVVNMTRWVDAKKRGSYYGIWSASHNLGEALTFISIAILVSHFSWRSGMIGAGIIGLLYFFVMITFMHDTPQSKGLLLDAKIINKRNKSDEFNNAQKAVLKNPAIWIIALSSAFMYISRYAVNSWGVFYLEAQKGYSTLDSSLIISISSVCGIIGTVCSGIISDKLFNSKRNIPALIFGIMNVVALCLFLLVPGTHFWLDATAMVFFGLAIGVLICFIGGLMAVDFAPRNASGAALGIVGIASYVGAGLQDVMSGLLIEGNKTIVDGVAVYDFTYINWFWIGSAALSAFLALFVWNAKQPEE
jgi:OPA family sugar phosphate sensor protein UhpC-like MFS transporter